jgi:hypothetical protein
LALVDGKYNVVYIAIEYYMGYNHGKHKKGKGIIFSL